MAETQKPLEKRFEREVSEWENHIMENSYSSNLKDYKNCQSYRNIVSMGEDVLPFILSRMRQESILPNLSLVGKPYVLWSSVIGRIVGPGFSIPKGMQGKLGEIFDYTLVWLDNYLRTR